MKCESSRTRIWEAPLLSIKYRLPTYQINYAFLTPELWVIPSIRSSPGLLVAASPKRLGLSALMHSIVCALVSEGWF